MTNNLINGIRQRFIPSVAISVFSLTLAGCANLGSAPGVDVKTLHERDGSDVILIPADYRETFFMSDSEGERHCRAPDPDFTVQSSTKIGLGVTTALEGDEVGSGSGQAALTLGGRSPALLITRELMYRACELSSNIAADGETTVAIYDKFLQAIESISAQQSGVGTTSVSDAISAGTSAPKAGLLKRQAEVSNDEAGSNSDNDQPLSDDNY